MNLEPAKRIPVRHGHPERSEGSAFSGRASPAGAPNERRTTEEVFRDHLDKRKKRLVEEDVAANYSPDVVQLTCMGIYRGHEGVREGSRILRESLPDASFEYYNVLVEGEMAFLEWRARADGCEVREGADSFLIRDGKIVGQTIHYKVEKTVSGAKDPGHG